MADPNLALTVAGLDIGIRWSLGEVDDVVAGIGDYVDQVRASGLTHNLGIAVQAAARLHAYLGHLDRAREYEAQLASIPDADSAAQATSIAAIRLGEGDEEAAAAALRAGLAVSPIGLGAQRRTWRQALALTYVLVPETRSAWDATDLRGRSTWAAGWPPRS